jgi:hypothetical protein
MYHLTEKSQSFYYKDQLVNAVSGNYLFMHCVGKTQGIYKLNEVTYIATNNSRDYINKCKRAGHEGLMGNKEVGLRFPFENLSGREREREEIIRTV